MPTLKTVLDTRRAKADGTYPLYIRITQDSQTRSVALNAYLLPEQWDNGKQKVKRNYQNYKSLNLKIKKKHLEIEEVILELENKNENISAQAIKDHLDKPKTPTDYFLFAEKEIDRLKKIGKFGTARTYQHSINKLRNFSLRKSINFESLNYQFLEKWKTTMFEGGMKANSISVYLRSIRAIYNKAIKAGIVDASFYPFKDFKIPQEKTISRALSCQEIKKIAELDLPEDSPIWRYRNYFLLSFYLIGISFIDMAMLKVENIQDGRIIYRRRKTGKIYSIKILPAAEKIILHYCDYKKQDKTDFLLPIIPAHLNSEDQVEKARDGYRKCNKYLKKMAKLCGIDKPITTYYARYSWANIAKELGYSKDLIAEALGHEYGNKVTGIYLDHYGNKVIDEANERVTFL